MAFRTPFWQSPPRCVSFQQIRNDGDNDFVSLCGYVYCRRPQARTTLSYLHILVSFPVADFTTKWVSLAHFMVQVGNPDLESTVNGTFAVIKRE